MNKALQKFLNWLLVGKIIPLVEDGILGEKSNRAIQLAIAILKKEFAKRGWSWDENFNFIGIRTDNDFDDSFDDFFVIFVHGTLLAVPASTVSGLQAVLKGSEKWHKGVNGTLVIKADQQIDYLFVNPKDPKCTFPNKVWSGCCFFYQDRDFYYLRDNNNDRVIDYGKVYFGGAWEIGGNIHSWLNVYSNIVNNLSVGCQVTTYDWWSKLEPVFIQNARIVEGQTRITYSLMQLDHARNS